MERHRGHESGAPTTGSVPTGSHMLVRQAWVSRTSRDDDSDVYRPGTALTDPARLAEVRPPASRWRNRLEVGAARWWGFVPGR